ncbi:MAG: YifB family Mg chelatase-like AAA ATPase [Polyangiales bacterium]
MLATAHAAALVGLVSQIVRVEVQSGRGTASFDVVGLPEATVRESRVRVRASLAQLGVPLHSHALTVNLAPADLRKVGSAFDLAIAVATLAAVGAIEPDRLAGIMFLGELSLDGTLHPIRGVLPRLRGAASLGLSRAIVPHANGGEAAVVAAAEGLEVFVARDLAEVVEQLRGNAPLAHAVATRHEAPAFDDFDLADVRGQPTACEALVVAAAGMHDVLFWGPPGSGKSMLARRLPALLPPLGDEEALTVTALHSVAGLLPEGHGLLRSRPYRAPHHSVTEAGLLGGGDPPRPGELSLAHEGVLFLDELPEFRRSALEGLRQPLEDGFVRLARARWTAAFPTKPLVVAAMNPCPCGNTGARGRVCNCTPDRVRSYESRVSGPIRDRFDLTVRVGAVDIDALIARGGAPGPSSAMVRERVHRAREIQAARFRAREVSAPLNARLGARDLERVVPLAPGMRDRLMTAASHGLTARGFNKLLRVARTLADLAGRDVVGDDDVGMAIQFRGLGDRPEAKESESTKPASGGVAA